jgi:hypothetical protein
MKRTEVVNKVIAVFLFLFTVPAIAGPNSYECEILDELWLEDNGEWSSNYTLYKNQKFHVERKTGVILGAGLGNSSSEIKQVIDPGDQFQSYKLISIDYQTAKSETGRNVTYLTVKEFVPGPKKPFIAVTSLLVLNGTCS